MKEEQILCQAVKSSAQVHTDSAERSHALPGLLQPLVESICMLGKLLTQLVIFLLPPLLLLQLQLSLLHSVTDRKKQTATRTALKIIFNLWKLITDHENLVMKTVGPLLFMHV